MAEGELNKLIECPPQYSPSDDGCIKSSGGAVGRIDEQNVQIIPKMGEHILFSPREVLEFAESDYVINLLLTSKQKLVLLKFGINFENFSRMLSKARNDVVMKDMQNDGSTAYSVTFGLTKAYK